MAIDLITQHIKSKLSCHELCRHYPNLEIMPSNFQVRQHMHAAAATAAGGVVGCAAIDCNS